MIERQQLFAELHGYPRSPSIQMEAATKALPHRPFGHLVPALDRVSDDLAEEPARSVVLS